MAQLVGFWDDDVVYTEGPFVVCALPFGHYRIEVEAKTRRCPGEIHESLRGLLEEMGAYAKVADRSDVVAKCDRLNDLVREERIVFEHPYWVLAT